MPIGLMDSANSPGVTSYTLLMGEDVPLYNTAAGYIAATGGKATFGLPPQSSVWRGQMFLQAVPNTATGGTGALTADLEMDMTGTGNNFQKVVTGIALVTAGVATIQKVDVSGLGGEGLLRLNPTTVTVGTATGFNVWARIG